MYGVAREPWIAALSILVAIQGCYVALGLTLKVAGSEGTPVEAIVMGTPG
jgi:NO-binding membrane sensor protein with MHYT domain